MTTTTTSTTATTATTTHEAYERVVDYANRADPYPFYAQLRETPVARLDERTFLVTGHQEILELVHDPRISSDPRNLAEGHTIGGHTPQAEGEAEESPSLHNAFVMLDAPKHDRLRSQTMQHFGPPHHAGYIDSMRADMTRIVNDLIDGFGDEREVDLVEALAYPFPVTVICEVLGVPRQDEPRFHAWSEDIIATAEATSPEDAAEKRERAGLATTQLTEYLSALADAKRDNPTDDLISGLVNDDGPGGPMSRVDMLNTAIMLLIGGHETTVNMIANGVLTLLRSPEVLERLEREPEHVARVFEELLRYEPPAQVTPTRVALADITLGGVLIPKGSSIWVVWAAANRDPRHFAEPDQFDPDREQNDHLGFGGGVHSCFGAPLARLEVQIALTEIFRRLENPRLVVDPPPYRLNPFLRGPSHLRIAFDGVRPR